MKSMKQSTNILLALAATAGISSAATLVSLDFSNYTSSTINENDLVTNTGTVGGAARWVVDAPVNASDQVDTSSNNGHMRFDGLNGSSNAGFAMNLLTTSYTFAASVDFDETSGDTVQGLFGQINSWTAGDSEWWIRKNGTSLQFLVRDADSNQAVGTFAIGTSLDGAGFHDIEFRTDHSAKTMGAYVDNVQIGSDLDISSITGIVGESTADMYVGAYNGTASNRFDGLAESYSITAVPEPSSAALLGLGGVALLFRRRK